MDGETMAPIDLWADYTLPWPALFAVAWVLLTVADWLLLVVVGWWVALARLRDARRVADDDEWTAHQRARCQT